MVLIKKFNEVVSTKPPIIDIIQGPILKIDYEYIKLDDLDEIYVNYHVRRLIMRMNNTPDGKGFNVHSILGPTSSYHEIFKKERVFITRYCKELQKKYRPDTIR